MKSYIVIGLGLFGAEVARKLCEQGCEVLAMDIRNDLVQQIADDVTHAVVGDGQDKDVLRALGAGNFDCAIIAIGDDLAASVLTTMWCVDDFIIGSVAVFAVSKLLRDQKLFVRLLCCIALFSIGLIANRLWAALCVLGYLLRLADEITVPKKISIPLSVMRICLIPWMIRRGENDLTHLLDGIACLSLLWIIGQFGWMQRVMSWKPLTLLGSYTFELFLLHVPLYHIIETVLETMQIHRPPQPVYYLYFILVLPFTVLCAIGWRKLADRTLNPLLRRISRSLP